jgi:serine-type D-Ala-D-Ala carboxypeptidase (penicillin-binding protein 5/6)
MQLPHPREIEQWLLRHTAWPAFLLVSLVAMSVAVVREASAGETVPTPRSSWDSFSSAAAVTTGPLPRIQATAAFVFDGDTGAVYFASHADAQLAMASCTKIMTAYVAVHHASPDQVVTIGADAASYVNPDNSYMGLSAGEQLTLRDLLYGLLLPSGNDAAIAIADAVGGSESHFVAMMNDEARALGLTHTHFANPHGLDAAGHYTSARDLAVLAAYALHDPFIAQAAATFQYDIPKTATHKHYYLTNFNSLLPGALAPYPGAVGLKPGNTGAAGWCEAFAARRDGHLIVGVVLGDPTWSVRNSDMHLLLDWGFAQVGVPPAG